MRYVQAGRMTNDCFLQLWTKSNGIAISSRKHKFFEFIHSVIPGKPTLEGVAGVN